MVRYGAFFFSVGLIGIEEFVSKPNSISLFSINNQLANQCYLVLHDQNGSKESHMQCCQLSKSEIRNFVVKIRKIPETFFEKSGHFPERFLAADFCCPEQVSLYHFHTKTCFNFNITKEN
jgi:hypothetical protein